MRAAFLIALMLLGAGCKSDCEKAAESMCSDSKDYDDCFGAVMFRCARKAE